MAITTGKVRASYVHIFTPRVPDNGGEPKYCVTLLIPKNDVATLNAIYADIERAKQEGAQRAFGGNIPPQCKTPIYDGDGYRPSGEAFGEECRGHMVLTASAKQQPVVVGLDMQNIINPADVYSGCYIRASINFFAYNSNGNKGIGCGLNAVQKIEDGEPLSARVSAEEAFGGSNTYTAGPSFGTGQAAPSYPQSPGYIPAPNPYQMPGSYQMPSQAPMYGQQTAAPTQPQLAGYNQQTAAPQAPYQQPAIDPITGRPMVNGGVMGI